MDYTSNDNMDIVTESAVREIRENSELRRNIIRMAERYRTFMRIKGNTVNYDGITKYMFDTFIGFTQDGEQSPYIDANRITVAQEIVRGSNFNFDG